MKAEILSVGTELLLGNITNTDARDLSVTLSELGINVYWHSVVGDNPARLRESIAIAKSRADLIITTGGLGPTCDDLTKQTLCEAFGLKMYRDERAEADIRAYFSNNHLILTDNNFCQADLPEGCTVFYNTCGTAPGCGFCAEGKHVLMLPGPPKECRTMMEVSGIPYLRSVSESPIFSSNIHIFGLGESFVESKLRDTMNSLTNPTLAPYAREGEVRLRVTARAETREKADGMMAPVIETVRAEIGDYIYGIDTDSLEKTVLELLKEKKMTFAAAESCTGGLIAKRITDLSGASEVFRGGVTVYTNDAKHTLLGVPTDVLETCGAVSEEVARLLAVNVREKLGADFGVGVTGLAGPDGDGVHEVGTVFVSFAWDGGCYVKHCRFGTRSDRSRIRALAANTAFDLIRRYLTNIDLK